MSSEDAAVRYFRKRPHYTPPMPSGNVRFKDGEPVFVFAPKENDPDAPRGITARDGVILPGWVFAASHLPQSMAAQTVVALKRAGHVRVVGKAQGTGLFMYTDRAFIAELEAKDEAIWQSILPPEARAETARPRNVHTRDQRPPKAGTPIYQVMPSRGVMGIGGAHLREGSFLVAGWLHLEPDRAETIAAEYFADRAIRKVGVYEEHGRERWFEEKDFETVSPRKKSLADVSKVKGGVSMGAPVFVMERNHEGLERGEVVTLSVVPLEPPGNLAGTLEGARAGLRALLEKGVLRRLGRFEESADDGRTIVAEFDGPADYLGAAEGFYGELANKIDRIEEEREAELRAEEVRKQREAEREPEEVEKQEEEGKAGKVKK